MDTNDFQAGILKGHGRDNCYFIFVQFVGGPVAHELKIQQWTREFSEVVTSHQQQIADTKMYKANLANQSFVVTLGFTQAGLNKANASVAIGDKVWMNEDRDSRAKNSIYYKNTAAVDALARPIDLIIIVAHDSQSRLASFVEYAKQTLLDAELIRDNARDHFWVKASQKNQGEFGHSAEKHNVGPFGFMDGMFNKDKPEDIYEKIKVPEDKVLVGKAPSYGTFMSFIRFRANRESFTRSVNELGSKLLDKPIRYLSLEDKDYCKSLLVGRQPNGYLAEKYHKHFPVIPPHGVDVDEWYTTQAEDAYANDPNGRRCPFGAHVRAMRTPEPKEETGSEPYIVRRGMPFIEWKDGEFTTGLNFISYQKSFQDYLALLRRAEHWQDYLIYRPRSYRVASEARRPELNIKCKDEDGRWREIYPYGEGYLKEEFVSWRGEALFYFPSKYLLRNLAWPLTPE